MGEAARVEAAVLLEMIEDAATHRWMGMRRHRWRGDGGAGVLGEAARGRRLRWRIGGGSVWEVPRGAERGRRRGWKAAVRRGPAVRCGRVDGGRRLREDRVGVGSAVEMGREKK
jgi:hypothetical protein